MLGGSRTPEPHEQIPQTGTFFKSVLEFVWEWAQGGEQEESELCVSTSLTSDRVFRVRS